MRICVSPDLCCGAQLCVEIAPEVYALNDEGFNALVGADPVEVAPELEEKAREGAQGCPESAIQILA